MWFCDFFSKSKPKLTKLISGCSSEFKLRIYLFSSRICFQEFYLLFGIVLSQYGCELNSKSKLNKMKVQEKSTELLDILPDNQKLFFIADILFPAEKFVDRKSLESPVLYIRSQVPSQM